MLTKLQKIKQTEKYINDYVLGKICIINAIVTGIPKESTVTPTLEPIFARRYLYFPVLVKDTTCDYRKKELKFYALVYMKKEIDEKIGISVPDLISFKASIQKPKDEQDKWKFQFKKFLYANGYMVSIIIQNSKQIINNQRNDAFDIRKLYFYIYEFLDTKVNTQREHINFLQSLLFGATYKLSAQQKEVYINAGTYHFFAVSGFSVMVLYIFLLIPLRALLLDYRIIGLLGILIIWLYLAICGFVPSALRAGIIITFFLLANILYRKENHVYSLLLAFIFILIFDNPFAIFDISFQYSFITYSAIMLILTNVSIHKEQSNIEIPLSQTRKQIPIIIYYFITVIAKLNEKRAEIIDSLSIIGRLVNTTIDTFISVILMTLVASISILPLTIKYFGLGKVLFMDNLVANCICSLFFSAYFIISLIFLLLLFIFGSLPNLFWCIFKGIAVMEWILSKITSNNTYFCLPTEISVYLFYIFLSAIAVLIYTKRLSIFKGIFILVCMHFSFMLLCNYPKKYTTNSLYSTTNGKNTVYYYLKTNNDIIILSINKFNKQLFYQTLSFLRYVRFINGNVTFYVEPSDMMIKNPIYFKNFSIYIRDIEEFQEKNIKIRKMKVSKKLYNLFISTNNLSVLCLQSVNKQWLINFMAKNKIDVIEITNKARKPSTENILCNSSNLIINRSNKFNISCDKTKILKTSETIHINAFLKKN